MTTCKTKVSLWQTNDYMVVIYAGPIQIIPLGLLLLISVFFAICRDANTADFEETHTPLFEINNKSLGMLRTKIEGG